MKKIIFWYIFIIVLLSLFSMFIYSFGYNENTGLQNVSIAFHNDYEGAVISAIENKMHFFEKKGINIRNVFYSSNLFEIEAINEKRIQFGYINDIASIKSNNNIEIICLQNIGNSLALISKKSNNINCLSDLEYKKIASPYKNYVLSTLKNAKVDLNSIKFINMDINGTISSLMVGNSDAVCVSGTYRHILEDKLKYNFNLLYEENNITLNGWIVNNEYMRSNKKTVKDFILALSESIEYWSRNEELCAKWTAEFLDIDFNIIINEIGKYKILDKNNLSTTDKNTIKEYIKKEHNS